MEDQDEKRDLTGRVERLETLVGRLVGLIEALDRRNDERDLITGRLIAHLEGRAGAAEGK